MGNKLVPNPTTIGDKLKNRRIELGLLQKDVAILIGVCEDSITFWENNRIKPSVIYYPKIIQFLGYVPVNIDTSTLGGQIKLYRYLNGLTQGQLAHKLNINESTLFNHEKNEHRPSSKVLREYKALYAQLRIDKY